MIAHNTFHLHPDAKKLLQTRLDELTTAHTLNAAVQGEKTIFVDWMKRKLSGKDAEAECKSLITMYGSGPEAQRLKKELPTPEKAIELLDDLAKRYDEMAKLTPLPPKTFQVKWKQFFQRAERENVLADLILPSLDKAHGRDAVAVARRAIVKAAVRESLGDTDAKSIKDPFGDSEFTLTRNDDNIEITSALEIEGETFSMSFRK